MRVRVPPAVPAPVGVTTKEVRGKKYAIRANAPKLGQGVTGVRHEKGRPHLGGKAGSFMPS